MENELRLTELGHTWLFDIDGTLLKHNGYKDGGDEVLEGVEEFFNSLREEDTVVLLTARSEDKRAETEKFLRMAGIRYDHIIFGLPTGERILVNDDKPSGRCMGYALNKRRDEKLEINCVIDAEL